MTGPRLLVRKHDYQAVLDAIIAFKTANDGNSPSVRELMSLCGVASSSNMAYILEQLEREGKIVRNGDKRYICVPGGQWTWAGRS